MTWDAVILAAGRGRRLGGPKALLDMGGVTLLELQLRALRGAARIAVVTEPALWEGLQPRLWEARPGPTRGETPLPQVLPVSNTRWDEGPFTSIRLGLEALGGDAPALVVPVDCPVAPEVPARLVAAAARGLAWVAPTWEDRRGHPVLLTPRGRYAARTASPDATLRDLLDGSPGAEVPVASPLVRCNLNTPADRDRFLADHRTWPDLPPGDAP